MRVVTHNSTNSSHECGGAGESERAIDAGHVTSGQVAMPPWGQAAKRSFDIVVAIFGMILLSPIFLFVSIAVKITFRGSVFCRHARHGYDGNRILVLKFRTEEAPRTRNASDMTYVGRALVSTGIDGLPQLINVLRGELSIVGPEPLPAVPGAIADAQISLSSRQRRIKPGLTGWAQVNGCWAGTKRRQSIQRRIEYDLHYIEHWSFWLDVKIIAMTLFSAKSYLPSQ